MSVIRKGKAAMPTGGNSKFLKTPEGEAVVFTVLAGLDELISIDQHAFWDSNPAVIVPCVGADCPACKLGNKPKFKAFLPVLTKEDGTKIYAFGIQVLRQLESLEEELGSLVGQVIKVKRYGTGLSTKYTVVAVGKKVATKGVDVPDVIEAIGPTTHDEVVAVMVEAGLVATVTATKKTKTHTEKPVATKDEAEDDTADAAWDAVDDSEDGWETA